MHQKRDLFLSNTELPKGVTLPWALINDKSELIKLSEPLYKLLKKPIATVLKQPLSKVFPSLDTQLIDVTNFDSQQSFHFIDEHGRAMQVLVVPKGKVNSQEEGLWSLIFTVIDLEESWLMQLHPGYHSLLQSSDEWLQQIELVINAKADTVIKTAMQQALALTSTKVGYLHLYSQKKNKILRTLWTEHAESFFDIPKNQKFETDVGMWAETIANNKPVIHNDGFVMDNDQNPNNGYFPFSNHLCVPINYRNKIVGIIGVGNGDKHFTMVDAKSLSVFAAILWHSVELPRTISTMTKQSEIIKHQQQKMALILVQLVGAISEALELKDAYTSGHQKSVAQLSYLIGEKMGLDAERLEGLKLGALIHDIGKVAVPSQILTKPSRLTDAEYELIKQHPEQGAMIVDEVEFPWPIQDMILQHHERLDGSGYPNGLTSDDILLEAKIIAVADVADSMLSHRPYRPSLGMEVLREVLLDGRNKIFDAQAVDLCLDILEVSDIKTTEHVGSLPLGMVTFLEEYHTIEQAQFLMEKDNNHVAVVLSENSRTTVGVVDQRVLDFWRSPFLDTAAERVVDRNLIHKRVHQVMSHSVNLIPENTLLKDAKNTMEQLQVEYLLVYDIEHKVIGILTWKMLASAVFLELENERSNCR